MLTAPRPPHRWQDCGRKATTPKKRSDPRTEHPDERCRCGPLSPFRDRCRPKPVPAAPPRYWRRGRIAVRALRSGSRASRPARLAADRGRRWYRHDVVPSAPGPVRRAAYAAPIGDQGARTVVFWRTSCSRTGLLVSKRRPPAAPRVQITAMRRRQARRPGGLWTGRACGRQRSEKARIYWPLRPVGPAPPGAPAAPTAPMLPNRSWKKPRSRPSVGVVFPYGFRLTTCSTPDLRIALTFPA